MNCEARTQTGNDLANPRPGEALSIGPPKFDPVAIIYKPASTFVDPIHENTARHPKNHVFKPAHAKLSTHVYGNGDRATGLPGLRNVQRSPPGLSRRFAAMVEGLKQYGVE